MVTLDWETDRTDGVTLVRLYVTAEGRRRVRIENRIEGPVWPPREEGQPAAGWDDGTFEGVVAPGHRLVAGYATPEPPTDPPAEVVDDDPAGAETPLGPVGAEAVETDASGGRATATDGSGGTTTGTFGRHDNGDRAASGPTEPLDGDEPTPEGVVRSLGDPVVPREAVPVPDVLEDPAGQENGSRDEPEPGPGHDTPSDGESSLTQEDDSPGLRKDDSPGPDEDDSPAPREDGSTAPFSDETAPASSETAGGSGERSVETEDGAPVEKPAGDEAGTTPNRAGLSLEGMAQPQTDAELVVPGPVRAWLRDVDRRLAAVERRQAAETTDPDPTVQIAVAGDRRALASVADRVETLVGRAQAVEHGATDPDDGGR